MTIARHRDAPYSTAPCRAETIRITRPHKPNPCSITTVSDVALAAQTLNSDYPLEVGRVFRDGVRLETNLTVRRLESDDAKKIMDACEPCGLNFKPTRQFGHYYAIERTCPPDSQSDNWDQDQTITRAIAFSRWVHDSSFGFEYAARIQRDESAVIAKICPLRFGPQAFCTDTAKTWVTPDEWTKVSKLLSNWSASFARGCPRIERAIWYREHAAREYYVDVRWVQLVTAVESLVSTWDDVLSVSQRNKGRRGKRFHTGAQNLARHCGTNLSEKEAEEAWNRRSAFVHAGDLPNPSNGMPGVIDPLYLRLQFVLDQALQRVVLDDEYARNFESEETVTLWLST